MKSFSFIILTYNEEIHLPRLLKSIEALQAPIWVIDSGSTDSTIEIARSFGVHILVNTFENHPKQWDFALKNCNITTEWIIGLDADQIVTPELLELLGNFNPGNYDGINGIYFNRKNHFKGRWIKYGGYFPKFLLKMFRTGVGKSDLTENMDHRFIVPGKTIIWQNGYLIEENLKENNIFFWIEKHNRYSNQIAQEEFNKKKNVHPLSIIPRFWGTPDERIAWLKKRWRRLPLFIRPFLYFHYRYFFQLGFLDGKQGFIFHFLHAFWFRLLVDIKIDEMEHRDQS